MERPGDAVESRIVAEGIEEHLDRKTPGMDGSIAHDAVERPEQRVPVSEADPGRGNGIVLVEPPHVAFGPIGRESVLGRELLFGDGFSYAAVGCGANGLNILDAAATDAVIAGEPVESPGSLKFGLPPDEGIIVRFVNALAAVGCSI